tara:strand:+ start:9123 stop:10814 length:1692 start_codon:yes stop_codon:yes gene_type:complete
MPKVELDNQYEAPWSDYQMYNRTTEQGKKYITGYRKKDGKQLRKYEYQKALWEDDDVPNSIEDINKITTYSENPKLWMKLYMRGSRGNKNTTRKGYDTKGSRKNPQKRYPDSKFQGYGGKVKKSDLKKIEEHKKSEKVAMKKQKEKHEEQGKVNKIIDEITDAPTLSAKPKKVEISEDEEDPEILATVKKGKGLTDKQKKILKKWRAEKGADKGKETLAKNIANLKKEDKAKSVISKFALKKVAPKREKEKAIKVAEDVLVNAENKLKAFEAKEIPKDKSEELEKEIKEIEQKYQDKLVKLDEKIKADTDAEKSAYEKNILKNKKSIEKGYFNSKSIKNDIESLNETINKTRKLEDDIKTKSIDIDKKRNDFKKELKKLKEIKKKVKVKWEKRDKGKDDDIDKFFLLTDMLNEAVGGSYEDKKDKLEDKIFETDPNRVLSEEFSKLDNGKNFMKKLGIIDEFNNNEKITKESRGIIMKQKEWEKSKTKKEDVKPYKQSFALLKFDREKREELKMKYDQNIKETSRILEKNKRKFKKYPKKLEQKQKNITVAKLKLKQIKSSKK